MGLWSQKKIMERKQQTAPTRLTPEDPGPFTSFNSDFRYRRSRGHKSPAKTNRDLDRWIRRAERSRILDEAYHDHVRSPGEVVAVSSSETLGVKVGDVLRDPKLRPAYTHPSLQRWKIRRTTKGLEPVDLAYDDI